jgi:hypothetical protein
VNRLHRRITSHGSVQRRAAEGYSQVSGGMASPAAPGVMPLAQVLVHPHPGGTYSTLAYRGLSPVYAAGGEAVPATSPGRWAQLVAAGRP